MFVQAGNGLVGFFLQQPNPDEVPDYPHQPREPARQGGVGRVVGHPFDAFVQPGDKLLEVTFFSEAKVEVAVEQHLASLSAQQTGRCRITIPHDCFRNLRYCVLYSTAGGYNHNLRERIVAAVMSRTKRLDRGGPNLRKRSPWLS